MWCGGGCGCSPVTPLGCANRCQWMPIFIVIANITFKISEIQISSTAKCFGRFWPACRSFCDNIHGKQYWGEDLPFTITLKVKVCLEQATNFQNGSGVILYSSFKVGPAQIPFLCGSSQRGLCDLSLLSFRLSSRDWLPWVCWWVGGGTNSLPEG